MTRNKEIIASNIRDYLEAKEVKHAWVIERIGISRPSFYKLLKGEGDVSHFEEKILRLFRIKDSFYFHHSEIELPKKIEESNRERDFMNHVALSYHGEDNNEFKDGMKVFRSFVELLDVLYSVSNPSIGIEENTFDR